MLLCRPWSYPRRVGHIRRRPPIPGELPTIRRRSPCLAILACIASWAGQTQPRLLDHRLSAAPAREAPGGGVGEREDEDDHAEDQKQEQAPEDGADDDEDSRRGDQ